jgi:hypothetical protein
MASAITLHSAIGCMKTPPAQYQSRSVRSGGWGTADVRMGVAGAASVGAGAVVGTGAVAAVAGRVAGCCDRAAGTMTHSMTAGASHGGSTSRTRRFVDRFFVIVIRLTRPQLYALPLLRGKAGGVY